MPTCPSGHDSASTDFCDVCGMRMDGPAPLADAAPAAAGPASSVASAAPPGAPAEPCPQCGASRTGQFCEVCGFDFTSGQAPEPAKAAQPGQAAQLGQAPQPADAAAADAAAPGPDGPGTDAPGTAGDGQAGAGPGPGAGPGQAAAAGPGWTAVVTADRAYYDSVISDSGPDAASIEFPPYCPERRFRLSGREMRIGRRSVSRGLEPEIDLTGPPADPGVSHLHAVLIAAPDGTWAVLDPGSANGTIVNGGEIVAGVRVPLHDGDRICVGAWTVLTVQAPAG
jgi:hypothetical protein